MTLNELIDRLKQEDPNQYVKFGFLYPHCHTADYSQLALDPYISPFQQVKDLIEVAESALANDYEDYNGNRFTMTGDSKVILASSGHVGFPIEEMLPLMLSTPQKESPMIDEFSEENILKGVYSYSELVNKGRKKSSMNSDTEKKLEEYQIAGYRLAMRLLQSDSELDDIESEAVSLFLTKDIICKVMKDRPIKQITTPNPSPPLWMPCDLMKDK